MSASPDKDRYRDEVALKYQLYNDLFLTLPLDAVERAGRLLPLLADACEAGLKAGRGPLRIIEEFFGARRPRFGEKERTRFLFKVIQYVERQVVLVDALEDAAYREIHQAGEPDPLERLLARARDEGAGDGLSRLLADFGARVVLTAHPTQFYPGPVLAIIADLAQAVRDGDADAARRLLQQLGNTPFFKKEKPTPLDEAAQLGWYLGNVFYDAVGDILDELAPLRRGAEGAGPLLSIGFWPGGDRDGNPFVTCETTRRVADRLRLGVVECYRRDARRLKRRLSFRGVHEELEAMERRFHAELAGRDDERFRSVGEVLERLDAVEARVRERHQGMYLDLLGSFRRKLEAFGLHFASLDIRQDARTLRAVLEKAMAGAGGPPERLEELAAVEGEADAGALEDPLARDTLESLLLIRDIQRRNGEPACHRYIVSNCRGARDVAGLLALFRLAGWRDGPLSVDIVPLFESIDDLGGAGAVMERLYACGAYREHLRGRRDRQTVMLGFSDGTKDGGYLTANWAIYRAREEVTAASRRAGVESVFFDGRGGPPGRGGGNTYRFYSTLGRRIETGQIQVTVQGQTVSSYYGARDAALHNLRLLLAAGLENNLDRGGGREPDPAQRELLERLARAAHRKYLEFRRHPLFMPYLERLSPLRYYARSNIGSRPSSRGGEGGGARFEDLRAIPFTGAWAQIQQNVPGYFGLGTALRALELEGRLEECRRLYRESGFFEALIANSMQSMSKANFALTAWVKDDPEFGRFWTVIHEEFLLSREMALKVSGQSTLLEDSPSTRGSIALRRRVVLPLLVIQQYALMRIRSAERGGGDAGVYRKMVVRGMFGNINAARNAA